MTRETDRKQNDTLQPHITPRRGIIQRKCACGGSSTGGSCNQCAKEGELLQRKSRSSQSRSDIPASVNRTLQSPGQVLPHATREYMEPRFSYDFSKVRVHTDHLAAQSAKSIDAHAYTVGNNVVFGAGQFRPDTTFGKKLLAHELTHVVQQNNNGSHSAPLRIGQPNSGEERQADTVMSQITDSSRTKVDTPKTRSNYQGSYLQRFSSSSSSSSRSSDSSSSDSSGSGGGDSGGTGGGGSSSSCKVDVRATRISAFPLAWHLFIVHTDSTGTEFFYRGGPGGSCTGVETGKYGTIKGTHGRYLPGTIDWAPSAPSVTVLSGSSACSKGSCFASELSRIDATCTPYAPLGPNSNTVVSTLLNKCSVPRAKPVLLAPGWGDPDL